MRNVNVALKGTPAVMVAGRAILTIPKASESLAGRVEVVTLLPLSRAEIIGRRPAFLEKAFDGRLVKSPEKMIGADLVRTVLMAIRKCSSARTRGASRPGLGPMCAR